MREGAGMVFQLLRFLDQGLGEAELSGMSTLTDCLSDSVKKSEPLVIVEHFSV